jgi:hypothetical protein
MTLAIGIAIGIVIGVAICLALGALLTWAAADAEFDRQQKPN